MYNETKTLWYGLLALLAIEIVYTAVTRKGFGSIANDRDPAEDDSEDDSAEPGKIIGVNDGDIDGNGVPNFADGINKFGNQGGSGGPFVPMVLELKQPIDFTKAHIKFYYKRHAHRLGNRGRSLRLHTRHGRSADLDGRWFG